MPRQRSPQRERAHAIWSENNGTIALKDIASAVGVTDSQVRKWKSQDKWSVTAVKSNVAEPKGNVTNRSGAPVGNKNAVGNTGGPGGPSGNKKAVVTGEYETISEVNASRLLSNAKVREFIAQRMAAKERAQCYVTSWGAHQEI